jgi:ABC-type multidrug transport system ATPase subunit/ABC-type polysaccharide/polyol phosphate export permease
MQWMIETQGLTKYFPMASGWKALLGQRGKPGPCAVNKVNLLVRRGELFGLVGQNGAGKTTLIKLLTTLIAPSSGSIRIAGFDIREEAKVKRAIGLATSDERSFYWRLTGRQNLRFFSGLQNIPARNANVRIDTVLSQVGLEQVADRRFHVYSTGMRQRLAIARALLTEPSVIFMDEPTKGLDPIATGQLHKLIREHLIGDLGITVFLTSHDLAEVEKLCDRIAIMNEGKIQVCGSMIELRKLLGPVEKYRVEVHNLDQSIAVRIAEEDPGISLSTSTENHVCFQFESDHADDRLSNLIYSVQENRGKIKTVSSSPVSLDVIFEHLACRYEPEEAFEPLVQGNPVTADASSLISSQEKGPSSPVPTNSNRDSKCMRFYGRLQSEARIIGALVKRDMLSDISYRFSFFMQIVEIFLTITALYFLSRLIGQDAINQYLKPYGGNYFAFAIIGVAFYSYFNIGFTNFAEQLREAQTTGTLEAMLSTPAGLSTIVLGSSLWAFIMATLRVMIILLSGAFLLDAGVRTSNFSLALLVLLLTIASASSFGIIAASFIMVIKKGDPISWLFRSASWLLGGVVFPVAVLPLWMQKLALLLPTTHALRAMRLALLQGKSINDVLQEIAALCVFCFLLLPISLRVLKYAVQRAKQEGTLTHY